MKVKSSGAVNHFLDEAQLEAVGRLFSVLSEPSRLRVLQVLQAGPSTVGTIVSETGMKQANVSKQLGILYQAGVVARKREGNAVCYSIRLPLVLELCTLVCHGLRAEAEALAQRLK